MNRPVLSNKLIVEGWIGSNALDNAPFNFNDFDTIFVVGVEQPVRWHRLKNVRDELQKKNAKDYFRLVSNGYIFLKDTLLYNFEDTIKVVRVIAQGSKAKGQHAHFFLSVKDSMIAHSYVDEKPDTLTFQVKIPSNKLGSFNLYFDNDMLTETEDINLNIYEIWLDDHKFLAQKNQLFPIREGLFSSSSLIGKKIQSKLNLKTPVIVIDTIYKDRNKTKVAAIAFKKFLKDNNITISAINIYTQHNHSLRTNLTYRKVLGLGVNVGSIPTDRRFYNSFQNSGQQSYFIAVWDEIISLLGTVILN